MQHVIVTRFSVPRPQDPPNAHRHADRRWLDSRLELFHRYFASSVGRLAVPAVLLCSKESAHQVEESVKDLDWVDVVVQNEWYGGWSGSSERMVTRMDSDDALHEDWFRALESAPRGADVYCTKSFLRLDVRTRRLFAYTREEPSPLAAFRGGLNPFARDHADLEASYRTHTLEGSYLLQIVHGGNLSNRPPTVPFRRRVPTAGLEPFGIPPETYAPRKLGVRARIRQLLGVLRAPRSPRSGSRRD